MKLKGTDQDFYSTGPDLSSEAEMLLSMAYKSDETNSTVPTESIWKLIDKSVRLEKALNIYRSKFKCQDAEDILSGKKD
jgi:hypothetical protein